MSAIRRPTAALLGCAAALVLATSAQAARLRPLSLLPTATDLPGFTVRAAGVGSFRGVLGVHRLGENEPHLIRRLERRGFQVGALELVEGEVPAGRVSLLATAAAFSVSSGARWWSRRELAQLHEGTHDQKPLTPPPPIPGVAGVEEAIDRADTKGPPAAAAGALFTSGRCSFTVVVIASETANPEATLTRSSPAALTARRELRAASLALYRRTKRECRANHR